MFGWFGQSRDKAAARALYESALEAARAPVLFSAYGAPDTLEGRFEMLALHLALLLDRLSKAEPSARRLSQPLTEHFVVAMDDAMRDFGIGDLKVPQKVKKAAAALYDRHKAYAAATRAEGPVAAWQAALAEQLTHLAGHTTIDMTRLAQFAVIAARHLDGVSDSDLAAGRVSYPTPPA